MGMLSNYNELPRRKQRGINRNIFIAPRGGELKLYPPQEDSSASGGLNKKNRKKINRQEILIRPQSNNESIPGLLLDI